MEPLVDRERVKTRVIEILRTEYELRRSRNTRYSLRSFAKSLGISQSHLSLILSASRHVSLELTLKILAECAHDAKIFQELIGAKFEELFDSSQFVSIFPDSAGRDGIECLTHGVLLDRKEWIVFEASLRRYLADHPDLSCRIAIRLIANT